MVEGAVMSLTVLSYGAGQESSALLELYLRVPEFRARYAPDQFIVIMSDTGDEFPETYDRVEETRRRCREAGIHFKFLTFDMGYHSESWPSLRGFYRANDAIGSAAFPKTCSIRLKIEPVYRYLEHYLGQHYGVKVGRKAGIKEFAKEFGKINMLIGFAQGEAKRVTADSTRPPWQRQSINMQYPLIEMGWSRSDCQDLLHSLGLRVIPSNCMACPYLSLEELEYLRRFHPMSLRDWVKLEQAKLLKHAHKGEKNYGVFKRTSLPDKIDEAEGTFAHWTDDQVREYRYSHGHCVATSY